MGLGLAHLNPGQRVFSIGKQSLAFLFKRPSPWVSTSIHDGAIRRSRLHVFRPLLISLTILAWLIPPDTDNRCPRGSMWDQRHAMGCWGVGAGWERRRQSWEPLLSIPPSVRSPVTVWVRRIQEELLYLRNWGQS